MNEALLLEALGRIADALERQTELYAENATHSAEQWAAYHREGLEERKREHAELMAHVGMPREVKL